jgi:hypothetical protein
MLVAFGEDPELACGELVEPVEGDLAVIVM